MNTEKNAGLVYFPIKGEIFGHPVDDQEDVVLKPRYDNIYDPDAIEVISAHSRQHIGWLPRGTDAQSLQGCNRAKVVWKGNLGSEKQKYQKWDNKDYSWIVLVPEKN